LKIDITFFDAGGGHRAAANALKLSIEQQQLPWEVRLVNLQEVMAPIDLFHKVFRIRMEDIYNLLLRKGWTWGSVGMLRVMHVILRLHHPLQVKYMTRYWREHQPDVVLSVVPNFDRSMHQAFQAVKPGAPYVVVMTDIADYPPHFWLEHQVQTVFCGSAKAEQQAREISAPGSRIVRTSGMVIHPRFYEPITLDRRAERTRLGLDADLPTGLILFGGYGSSVMPKIVERLAPLAGRLQLIAICGKNEKLKRQMEAMRSPVKMFVEGFTKEVPAYMHTADFMIGKPGPGSISEALAMKLPVIVECNSWTLPQERYNATWVREQGVGLVVEDFRNIAAAITELLEPKNFQRYRSAAAAMENRAVFEIPRMLAEMLR
jgi:UDP-N-acetylglucosamine:LPS N-acetylglucosamine transferase